MGWSDVCAFPLLLPFLSLAISRLYVLVLVYLIVLWLPETDSLSKGLLFDEASNYVLSFASHKEAMEFAVDNLTPDWEFLIIPMRKISIAGYSKSINL